MRRFLRAIGRLVGWLLTPVVASAASFLGALAGAALVRGVEQAFTALILTLALAACAAVLATFLCLRWLAGTPEVREALQLDERGMPTLDESPAAEPPAPTEEHA